MIVTMSMGMSIETNGDCNYDNEHNQTYNNTKPVINHKKRKRRNTSSTSEESSQTRISTGMYLIVFFSGVSVAVIIMLVSVFPHFNYSFFFNDIKHLRRNSNSFWSDGEKETLNEDFFHTSLALKRRTKATKEVTNEALAALNVALDLESRGKHNKALRLFQHAYSLDPQHVEVLVEYGEYLEDHGDDLLLAAQMYTKALILSPDHSRALANKKRILPIVEELDQKSFNRIDVKREQFYSIPESHPGLRRAKRESYFLHIYHTNAIEGNTMTLMQTRAIVETRMAVHGKSIMEHNEILGLDAALSFINSTLIRRVGAITVKDILEIHKRVLGYVDPTEAGKFRNTQVFVGDYTPPSASDVSEMMEEFIQWLNADETLNLHPIEYAALAHYKLVFIHPFYDGNGRTSRLLLNLILMQAGFPPVIIKVDEKHEYYQHLQTANDGDIRPFIRFIAKCTERTLDEFLMYSSDLAVRNLASEDDGRTIIIDRNQSP